MPEPERNRTRKRPTSDLFVAASVIVVAVSAFLLLVYLTPMKRVRPTVRIPYSPAFLAQVRAGNVSADLIQGRDCPRSLPRRGALPE